MNGSGGYYRRTGFESDDTTMCVGDCSREAREPWPGNRKAISPTEALLLPSMLGTDESLRYVLPHSSMTSRARPLQRRGVLAQQRAWPYMLGPHCGATDSNSSLVHQIKINQSTMWGNVII